METNIYLDIDGVLIANERNQARYASEFLSYVLEHFPNTTYWLTTHCKGDAMTPIEHIGHLFDPKIVELMKKIKPTNWDVSKTDGIDFSKPFLWFDDDCYDFEREVLLKHGVLDNWIEIDLRKDEHQLQKFINSFPLPIVSERKA
ncbi:MAG: hypothetical protein Q7K28_01160 [Candidatus Wildermuthbacteria bacterium]|nr:hypothetical protein [Candidatus Wildermuthbacteria bacterium]